MNLQMKHRGRFQAQGEKLEESEPWAEINPLPVSKGVSLIDKLEKKLRKEDRNLRIKAFSKCKAIVKEAQKNNGINYPYKKSFFDSFQNRVERVDLEVQAGTAFVKDKEENEYKGSR